MTKDELEVMSQPEPQRALDSLDAVLVNDAGQESDKVSDEEVTGLRVDILRHLEALKLPSWAGGDNPDNLSKDAIRAMHAGQRREVIEQEKAALGSRWASFVEHFANGQEVRPQAIDPELIPARADDSTGDLFRFATLLWSVPVSPGYGRRMRYLVRDRSNGKLIGVFAVGDPVFNLRARDDWIGWGVDQRRDGLVHVMDAHVVGAVPPYSYLLGGKLVTSLIGSAEVGAAFARRYAETQGVISRERKSARLVLVTMTSALGRSSMYDRLKLAAPSSGSRPGRELVRLIRVGSTVGYGHFQLSDRLFNRLRDLVARKGHAYANAHQFGQGPNWRIRVSRVGLVMLGLDPELLRHGIAREIYVMPLAPDCREFLRGEAEECLIDRPRVREITQAALQRWMIPRANRSSDFASFTRAQLREQLRKLLEE